MINLKIMQFDQSIIKIIENAKADNIPIAALYLSLNNILNSVYTEMGKEIQKEYSESPLSKEALPSGEPIIKEV